MRKRWKKRTKMFVTAAVAMTYMCAGSGVTVFTNVDQVEIDAVNAVAETEAPVIDRSGTEGDTFSVPGNGEVVDYYITEDSSKEFYIIRTANNNTFYMVIDRSATSDNVYISQKMELERKREKLEELRKSVSE